MSRAGAPGPATALDASALVGVLAGPEGTVPLVVDVRSAGEFAGSRVPGSVNLPVDDLARGVALPPALVDASTAGGAGGPAREVVLVCRSGRRAERAQGLLEAAGTGPVRVLTGGLQAYEAAGGAVERGTGPWAMERQVRLAAGGLVLAGVLASAVVPRATWFSAAIGGGLVVAAVTDTCAMGAALARLPWNRAAPTRAS